MPIFGLVWVASWVSCFFSSSQDLLRAPSYLSHVLPIQAAYRISGAQTNLLINVQGDRRHLTTPTSHSAQPLTPLNAASVQVPLLAALNSSDTVFPTSINLFNTFKNLFSGLQKLTSVPESPPPPVVVMPLTSKQVASGTVLADTAGMGFERCLPVPPTADATGDRANRSSPKQLFQVKVKNYIVSSALGRKQATRIARQLEQALRTAKPKLNQIQPALVKNVPVGKLGDRVLFSVDQQTAEQWDCNPEVLAIQWVNDLRVALSQAPLSFAEAQTKLYGLQGTGERIDGTASWYGPDFHGRQTATGETFNQYDFTAAHPSLPFNTYLKVTNLANGKSVIVRVNDRGPYFEDRTLDLSREAARCLGSETDGVVSIEAEIMQPAKSFNPGQAIAQRL